MNTSQSAIEVIQNLSEDELSASAGEMLRHKALAAGSLRSLTESYARESRKVESHLEKIGSSIRVDRSQPVEDQEKAAQALTRIQDLSAKVSDALDLISDHYFSLCADTFDSEIFECKKDKSGKDIPGSWKLVGNMGEGSYNSVLNAAAKDALACWDGTGVLATSRKESASKASIRFEVGDIVEIKSDSMRAMIADKSFEIVALQGSSKKVASQEYILKGSNTGTKYPAAKHSEYRLK